jgi:hypothetical protein
MPSYASLYSSLFQLELLFTFKLSVNVIWFLDYFTVQVI